MTRPATTIELPRAPDLSRAKFEFERSRNEAARSANRDLILERFPRHWTVVYEGGRLAAFDDPQEFLAFLRRLDPFAADSASARPPWSLTDDSARHRRSKLTEQSRNELERNRAFWTAHRKQLVADHPHEWIVVYGGGEVATPADQRELWVFQHDCDPASWKVSLRSSPRKPLSRWKPRQPDLSVRK